MPLSVFRCPDHLVFGQVKEDLFVGVEFACRRFLLLADHGLAQRPPHPCGDNHADEVDKFGGVEPVVAVDVHGVAFDDVLVHAEQYLDVPPAEVGQIDDERGQVVLALEDNQAEAAPLGQVRVLIHPAFLP